jgi:hypothetical protein
MEKCLYKVFENRNNAEYVAAQSQQEAVDKYGEEFIEGNDEEAKKVLSVEFVGVVYV